MGTRTEKVKKTVKIDDRGRITIPKPVRERLGIVPGDEFEIETEGSRIVLNTEHIGGLKTASSRNEDWGDHTLDAGETLFGGSEDNGHG